MTNKRCNAAVYREKPRLLSPILGRSYERRRCSRKATEGDLCRQHAWLQETEKYVERYERKGEPNDR